MVVYSIYSAMYPWAPQEAQVTVVGRTAVINWFIEPQEWH